MDKASIKNIFNSEQPVFDGKLLHLDEIEILRNNKLQFVYDEQKKSIGREQILFHGTCVENLSSIIKNGFDLKYLGMPGHIGKGIYFSTLITQSVYYQLKKSYTGNEKKFTIFACKVLTGKHKFMNRSGISENIQKSPYFDSHCTSYKDDFREGYEFCIYDIKQILPFCLLHMTLTDVANTKKIFICAGTRKNGNKCTFKAIHAGFCKSHRNQHRSLISTT